VITRSQLHRELAIVEYAISPVCDPATAIQEPIVGYSARCTGTLFREEYLKGISAAGTGTRKEPEYVALQVVIDKMNDLFGAESFAESQVREFVQGLVQRLLAYPDLVNQTKVNSKKQFIESQDFQAAVTEAVVDNQEAHNTMADYFFSDGPGISAVIMALADAFYEAAIDQQTDV
jgi:type I restriction enzyme R subunit